MDGAVPLRPAFLAYTRRASLALVCHPRPVARNARITSRSTRMLMSCFVGAFCGPRWPRYRRIASTTSCGSASRAGRARRNSSSVHSGLAASGRLRFFRIRSFLSPVRTSQAEGTREIHVGDAFEANAARLDVPGALRLVEPQHDYIVYTVKSMTLSPLGRLLQLSVQHVPQTSSRQGDLFSCQRLRARLICGCDGERACPSTDWRLVDTRLR